LASSNSSFTFSRDGPPTGDFHPIYNAPMLGAHQKVQVTSRSARNLTCAVGEKMKLASDARYVHTYMHENNT
jgi:hypothetical protein